MRKVDFHRNQGKLDLQRHCRGKAHTDMLAAQTLIRMFVLIE